MAYKSNPKDWIAYYNFYISIALLSLWEAMTAQSLSKMANTKDNFLWNIEKKIEKDEDNAGKWESIEKLFNAFFSANESSEVDIYDKNTRVMLESLDSLMKQYDPINNLTKTVNSTDIAGLLGDIQNIETNVTLLGITIENGDTIEKKKEEMDKFLNGKELINENFNLSCRQVGTFYGAMGSVLAPLFGKEKAGGQDNISPYLQKLIDAANQIKDSEYNNIKTMPLKIQNSSKFTGPSLAGASLHFGWIMFFVIMIVSQFTEKGPKAYIEVVVFFIICAVVLFQYAVLNPELKQVTSLELIDFPKILTFLIFCIINSFIAAALVELIRNDDDKTKDGVHVLTTKGKNWRYGKGWEIIVSSIGSLALGFLLFQALPYFFTATKEPDTKAK